LNRWNKSSQTTLATLGSMCDRVVSVAHWCFCDPHMQEPDIPPLFQTISKAESPLSFLETKCPSRPFPIRVIISTTHSRSAHRSGRLRQRRPLGLPGERIRAGRAGFPSSQKIKTYLFSRGYAPAIVPSSPCIPPVDIPYSLTAQETTGEMTNARSGKLSSISTLRTSGITWGRTR
jgi:hypothetical protein